ncbi:MAG: oligosaccharide flippase family protein [Thermomicrobiales bacterium]
MLALVLPLAGLGVVPSAILQRTLRFRRKLVPDLTKGLVKGGVAIILAWQGFEAWA